MIWYCCILSQKCKLFIENGPHHEELMVLSKRDHCFDGSPSGRGTAHGIIGASSAEARGWRRERWASKIGSDTNKAKMMKASSTRALSRAIPACRAAQKPLATLRVQRRNATTVEGIQKVTLPKVTASFTSWLLEIPWRIYTDHGLGSCRA